MNAEFSPKDTGAFNEAHATDFRNTNCQTFEAVRSRVLDNLSSVSVYDSKTEALNSEAFLDAFLSELYGLSTQLEDERRASDFWRYRSKEAEKKIIAVQISRFVRDILDSCNVIGDVAERIGAFLDYGEDADVIDNHDNSTWWNLIGEINERTDHLVKLVEELHALAE